MEQWLGVLRMLRVCRGAVARCASYAEGVVEQWLATAPHSLITHHKTHT